LQLDNRISYNSNPKNQTGKAAAKQCIISFQKVPVQSQNKSEERADSVSIDATKLIGTRGSKSADRVMPFSEKQMEDVTCDETKIFNLKPTELTFD
jgi:hypothetical protein